MYKVTMAVALLALLAASAAAATTTPNRRLLQADPTATAGPALRFFQPSQCNKVSRGIVVCPVGRTYSCCDNAECVSVRDAKQVAKDAGLSLAGKPVCASYYACCKA